MRDGDINKRKDGSGKIRIGTLHAVIPSNNTSNDQEEFPSTTHES